MAKIDKIRDKLEKKFDPLVLEIFDESELHKGHAGYSDSGESHFRIKLVSSNFEGLSRVARHRSVHNALGKDLLNSIHALALELKLPE
tara:strand:- start:68 stop:331 length:264 start_codon:yes stop_codon:yes gene_type:complete